MANLFYGVCSTDAGEPEKTVTLLEENTIQAGDSLVVYFANGNTHSSPSLSIAYATEETTGETESTALTTDSGVTIKSLNVESNLDYMWQNGEAVIFTLIEQKVNSGLDSSFASDSEGQTTTNDIQYWMLNRGIQAKTDYYGLARLWKPSVDNNSTLSSLLSSNVENWNEYNLSNNSVLTLDALKVFYDLLLNKLSTQTSDSSSDSSSESSSDDTSDEGETEVDTGTDTTEESVTTITLGVSYTPDSESTYDSDEDQTIGVLSIGDTEYNIYYKRPISTSVTTTAVLKNEGENNEGHADRSDGGYYITNLLDRNLYFTGSDKTGIYRRDNSVNYELLTNSKSTVNETYLNKGYNSSPLYIYGVPISLYSDSQSSTPTLSLSKTEINAGIPVKAPEFYENDVSLETKYSRKLVVLSYETPALTMDGSSHTITSVNGHTELSSGKHLVIQLEATNCRILGVVGFNLNYAHEIGGSVGDPVYISTWECFIDSLDYLNLAFRNRNSSAKEFQVEVKVLCEQLSNFTETPTISATDFAFGSQVTDSTETDNT